jgi:hypothetical protein
MCSRAEVHSQHFSSFLEDALYACCPLIYDEPIVFRGQKQPTHHVQPTHPPCILITMYTD